MKKNSGSRPPVSDGDEMELEIISVGAKGDGVAKVEGYTVFVPGTNAGDKVKVKIKRALPQVAFAEIIE